MNSRFSVSMLCLTLVIWCGLFCRIGLLGESPQDRPPVPRVDVPRLKGGVTVDGKLSDANWQRALVLGPLKRNGAGEPATDRTQVRLFVDDEHIYLGWEVRDTDIQATFTERDSHFWEEEVVEFFLSTQHLREYFELQWNPLGGIFDAIIRNELDASGRSKKIDGEWGYTAARMKSRVSVEGTIGDASDEDKGWTVEAVIPFSDLNQKAPVKGTEWRANFYRFNRGAKVGVEKQSWSPTYDRSFHQPSWFGILRFE